MLFCVLSGCSGDKWEGIVYTDKTKLMINYNAGKFENLEACEKGSLTMLKSKDALSKGFYECGKNCASGASVYARSCEELIRGNFYK